MLLGTQDIQALMAFFGDTEPSRASRAAPILCLRDLPALLSRCAYRAGSR